jgi:hypothetical protein
MIRHYIDNGMKKRGHRQNMINKRFTHTGIAYCEHKKYKKMLVVVFAESALTTPEDAFSSIDQFLDNKAIDDIFSIPRDKKNRKNNALLRSSKHKKRSRPFR